MQFCLVMFWQFSTILVCFTSSWLSVHRITWYSSGNTLSLLLGLFSISNLQTGNPFTWATLEQQNKSLLLLTDLAVNLRHIETDLLPPLNTDLGKISDATRSDMINDTKICWWIWLSSTQPFSFSLFKLELTEYWDVTTEVFQSVVQNFPWQALLIISWQVVEVQSLGKSQLSACDNDEDAQYQYHTLI